MHKMFLALFQHNLDKEMLIYLSPTGRSAIKYIVEHGFFEEYTKNDLKFAQKLEGLISLIESNESLGESFV
jgi:hypothetical protein